MELFDWTLIAVIGLLWGAQIFLRSFPFRRSGSAAEGKPRSKREASEFSFAKTSAQRVKIFTIAFWLSVFGVLGFAAYDAEMQYLAWAQGGIGAFLLPPHQSIGYFWFYVGVRFFAPWLIALLAAILVGVAAERMNKRYDERFFETEEFPLIKIGFFLTGYPGFLFYLILALFAELIFSAFRTLFRGERAPLYFLWLPLAIIAIIIRIYLIPSVALSFFNL